MGCNGCFRSQLPLAQLLAPRCWDQWARLYVDKGRWLIGAMLTSVAPDVQSYERGAMAISQLVQNDDVIALHVTRCHHYRNRWHSLVGS